ncbi:unnamed protein product [Orchesella dallaii]|uniref:F-box domain-containing protein n=1 Tax=Orchesella dallaii TaxID=48710 RepID=A0ABP1RMS1_9HEXA
MQRQDGNENNPLLQYPVLKNLFEANILNTMDLKNARLVCKEWAKASLDRWRKEATLTLTDNAPPSPDDNSASSSKDGLALSEFLEMINTPGDPFHLLETKGFRKYNVKFSQDLCFSQPEKRIFWEKIGPLITHLQISKSRISSVEDLAGILFKHLPNLESFIYKNDFPLDTEDLPYPVDKYEMTLPWNWDEQLRPLDSQILKKLTKLDITLKSECFPFSWAYFFARVPNIKELKLQSFPDYVYILPGGQELNELFSFFRSLQSVRETLGLNYFSLLSKLDLFEVYDERLNIFPMAILSLLRDLRLPLTFLAFDISCSTSLLAFPEILKLHSDTLETLKVFRSKCIRSIPREFPYGVDLPHLKELHLSGPIFKNLNFLKKLPKLRHLELDYCCILFKYFTGNFSRGVYKNVVLPRIETLWLSQEVCGRETVKGLKRLMANLKKLKIGLGNQGFAEVCNTWKHLETLYVDPNFVTESAILGSVGGRKYSVPNITDLKELTTFAMGWEPGMTKGQLTSNSIVDGILACEKLKHVLIAAQPRASHKVREMLTSKFPQNGSWSKTLSFRIGV